MAARRKKDEVEKTTEEAPVGVGSEIEGQESEAEGQESEGTEAVEPEVVPEVVPVKRKTRNGRAIDASALAKVMRSFVLKGDLSALSPDERGAYYLSVCDRTGLDPTTKPFDFLMFQNKMFLYINRGGTDQLAFRFGVTREIVSGPSLIGDAKSVLLIMVKASMRMEDGSVRSHTDVAAVQSTGADSYMKVTTKGHRRAILGLIGLGMIDAPEGAEYIDARAETVETQRVLRGDDEPASSSMVAGAFQRGGLPAGEPVRDLVREPTLVQDQALAVALSRSLEGPTCRLPEDVVSVWADHRPRIEAAKDSFPGLMAAARQLVLARMMDMKDEAGKPWFSHPTSAGAYLRDQMEKRAAKVNTDGAGALS